MTPQTVTLLCMVAFGGIECKLAVSAPLQPLWVFLEGFVEEQHHAGNVWEEVVVIIYHAKEFLELLLGGHKDFLFCNLQF